MTTDHPTGDDLLVRRAARATGLRAAALVTVAMLLLVGLVTLVVVRGQNRSDDSLLRTTAQTADDVVDPPPDAWLLMERAGRVTASPGLPPAAESQLARLRVRAPATGTRAGRVQPVPDGTAIDDLRTPDRREYRVATERRDGTVVQVLLDLRSEHAQRASLLKAMGWAGLLALVFAAALGVLLGRRAVRPLAEALTLQRSFVADASHELRTPLTLLSTRAQLLDSQVRSEDSAGLVRDAERLNEVLDDLLVAADPRGNRPIAPVDVAALVTSAVESARPHAVQRGVELTGPGVSEELLVLGAQAALRRAVLSLLDNAIDHTPSGGQVSAQVRAEGRSVVIEVADTGPGLDPGAARAALRRFHSGGQRAGRAHYGLGLALTHEVADQHGGSLRVLPRDQGAAFALALPALSRRTGSSKTGRRMRGQHLPP